MDARTQALSQSGESFFLRRFSITVVDGPDRGLATTSSGEELSIGTDAGNDLVLTDPSVSRHHVVVRTSERHLLARDLSSTNGTVVGDCRLVAGHIKSGATLRLGRTTVAVEILAEEIEQPLARAHRFGGLAGESLAMRRLYPLLEQCAGSSATVLITGETGTGKEVTAEAIHQAGPRRQKPFVVVDCGALPRHLLESELYGHVRGAFTDAVETRRGAFEAAQGGTLFLDEIGELPLEMQPGLLRFLEAKTFRPVGGETKTADVRIISATNRDLRVEVNGKRFRADLFYRLDVLRVELPSLANRVEDIRHLAALFWADIGRTGAVPADLIVELEALSWPGNVRQLRNAVERAALIGWSANESLGDDEEVSFTDAKQTAVNEWERAFVEGVLRREKGNLSRAAARAQMSRSYLRQLMHRYGIERLDFVPG